jgi:hypothetical protein
MMTSFSRMFLALMLMCVMLPGYAPSFAQKGWQQTPYQQWTQSDAEKILTDSPWVKIRSKGGLNIYMAQGRSMGDETLRLRSALPVRQAIARMRQIKGQYDGMSSAQKAAFDEKLQPLLDCPACKKYYVVTLDPGPEMLLRLPFDTLKKYVRLSNENGEKRELAHLEPPKTPQGEAMFFFSRLNDKGEPLLTPTNKKLIVSLDAQLLIGDKMTDERFEFNVSQLMLNGEVAF